MIDVALFPEEKRTDLFRATSQKLNIHEAVIKKDFWVCWILDYLFQQSPWKSQLIFKGGTSLSKGYGLIERFSEDIDLILDWELLGYTKDDPWEDRSYTQQDKFSKTANLRTVEYLADHFAPKLREELKKRLKSDILITPSGQEILIEYPRAFALQSILPQIKLEIGPLAEGVPNEDKEIRSYAAAIFPEFFTQPGAIVQTLQVERSFWEKATILHKEAHRSPEKLLPPRYSRHYYDLYRISQTAIKDRALKRTDLLKDVVRFKMRFYRCPWARYEDAKPGSLKLLPPAHHVDELRKDYAAMKIMLFGVIPSFEEIMAGIDALEQLINRPKSE